MCFASETRWLLLLACGFLVGTGAVYFNWEWLVARFFLTHMESAKRIERLQVDQVVETLALQPGQKIADIGAGSGLFSFPMARRVGRTGQVYAIDINRKLVDHLAQEVKAKGLANVTAVPAHEEDPRIAEPVDMVFICDTLHHIEDPAAYLRKLRGYLKSSGRIAVIDFKNKWSLFHGMKYSVEELDCWMKSVGFELAEDHDFLENDFFVIYRQTD